MIKTLVGSLCLLAVVSVVSPCCACCFPKQLSVNFKITLQKVPTPIAGRLIYDYDLEKYYMILPMFNTSLYFDFTQKFASRISGKSCRKTDVGGSVGEDWRCIIDDTRFATEDKENSQYVVHFLDLVKGAFNMKPNSCILKPSSFVFRNIAGPEGPYSGRIELTNLREMFDSSEIEDPCPDVRSSPDEEFTMPTVEEFVAMVMQRASPDEPSSE